MSLTIPDAYKLIDEDPAHPVWGQPAWPSWFTGFRPGQLDTIAEIVQYLISGTNIVLLDAPTGAGKTLIAEAVRRALHAKAIYAPDSKTLQEQMARDFPYAKVLKGRANYPTLDDPSRFTQKWDRLTAADCVAKKEFLPACHTCDASKKSPVKVMHCAHCHQFSQCPYQVAKRDALDADLAILNTAYFISEANGPGQFKQRELGIIDEADVLEGTLMSQVEVNIPAKRIKQYRLDFPKLKTVSSSWLDWTREESIPKIRAALEHAQQVVRNGDRTVDTLREVKYLDALYAKLQMLRTSLEAGNAVYDGYDKGEIRFQPVNVAPFGASMVWQHAEQWLLMSATFIDPQEYVEAEVGIEMAGKTWDLVRLPSTYPKENRPIIVRAAADMTHKNKDVAWPQMRKMVSRVLSERHPGDRVLIHTVSYSLANYLYEELRHLDRPVYMYTDASERAGVLEQYKTNPRSVLLAPSMDRGIDLPNDLCRAIIVCKMPFPNTSDKRVRARMYSHNGASWYAVQVMRKLVQMTGRGMRSADDQVTSYILDSQFVTNVWKKNKSQFPAWWAEALDFSGGGL